MRALYAVSATAIFILGLLHMATTFRLSSTPTAKVWFFGTGIAIALCGLLNLLNRRYGLDAFGLRATCIASNVLMICFAVVAGQATGASIAERIGLLTLLGVALLLSTMRSPSGSAQSPRA